MAVTLQDERVIEGHLSKLRQLDDLRRLLADLNYSVVDEPVSTGGWKPELATVARDGGLRVIARHDDFVVTHCRLPELRLTPERDVVTRLLRQYGRGLFVFSDQEGSEWHFVNVKFDEGVEVQRRRLFRRLRVGPAERLRTAVERIALLKVEDASWTGLQAELTHDHAFDVEAVTRAFFDEYKSVFEILQDHLEKQAQDTKWAHDYALQFLNRLMFLYFVQRKRWLGGDSEFLQTFWEAYQSLDQPLDTFFEQWLSVLFFEAFNNQFFPKPYLPKDLSDALQMAPYLNGGLFSRNDLDRQHRAIIPDRLFRQVFTFFQRYNFTIAEDSPIDQEVAVDPEMIGKVYESLVNVSELSDERSTAGIFYTPRTEISLMCRLSLVDYLTNHLGEEHKPHLYDLVFALEPEQKQKADDALASQGLWPEVVRFLQDLAVVDPACGSGSFLVGMLSVLFDLSRRARPYVPSMEESDYELKKRIIGQNLYGVEVMRWAVDVAELRLWLQLVIETELHPAELKFRPLLPNLSFKVRPGDSLVQEVGGINLALRHGNTDIPPDLKGRITRLKAEKLRFYNNEPGRAYQTEEQIRHEELNIFRAILDARLLALQNSIASLTSRMETARVQQGQLSGMGRERGKQATLQAIELQGQLDQARQDMERTQQARQALRTVQDVPFVWDVAFVEVFEEEKGGFDIVIGNPPYVRQERIADPQLQRDQVTPENKRDYKAKLARSVYHAWPRFFVYKPGQDTASRKLDAKSDLYVYFYFLGLGLLNAKGSFCFITSNSWLDVGYGKDLQEFLLKHSHTKMVLDNRARRSFSQADINTVIVLLAPPDDHREWGLEKTARFVMFLRPFEYVLFPEVFWSIEDARGRESNELLRVNPVPQGSLLEEGIEEPEDEHKTKPVRGSLIKLGRYAGNKWGGKYLRAPDIYYTILEKGKGKLVPLGDVAEVRRGFTTGANDFFYLDEATIQRWNIEEEFLRPLVKSPRECRKIVIDRTDLKYAVFVCRKPKNQLKGTGALAYIHWGESTPVTVKQGTKEGSKVTGYHSLETTKVRERWYDLGQRSYPNLVWVKSIDDTHRQALIPFEALVDQRLYEIIYPRPYLLNTVLNSFVTMLFKELEGRVNMGEGVLDTAVYEAKRVLIVDPLSLKHNERDLRQMQQAVSRRPILPVQDEAKTEDRRFLDDSVFDALGLTQPERDAVYEAVISLVEARLQKATSTHREPVNARRRQAAVATIRGIWQSEGQEPDENEEEE